MIKNYLKPLITKSICKTAKICQPSEIAEKIVNAIIVILLL